MYGHDEVFVNIIIVFLVMVLVVVVLDNIFIEK